MTTLAAVKALIAHGALGGGCDLDRAGLTLTTRRAWGRLRELVELLGAAAPRTRSSGRHQRAARLFDGRTIRAN